MIKYSLKGSIGTDKRGYQKLLDFYNYARQYSNCWFNLDITELDWFEANLSANLFLLIHLLKTNNKIKFFIDYKTLNSHLDVLRRNGFAYYTVHDKKYFERHDPQDTTIPIRAFKINEVDKYVQYIERTLLRHRGLDNIKFHDKRKLKNSYFEIFDNVGIHANSALPIFACGQYFPSNSELKFTLVDYGDGFLKGIKEFTKDNDRIKTASSAIDWALKGNSTKKGEKGGTGLRNIMSYCIKNGGSMHIISDDTYWELSNKKIVTHKLNSNVKGVTINLIFKYLKN